MRDVGLLEPLQDAKRLEGNAESSDKKPIFCSRNTKFVSAFLLLAGIVAIVVVFALQYSSKTSGNDNNSSTINSSQQGDLEIITTQGKVVGHINELGMKEWKGIRYGQPPVGLLRWEAPIAPKPSDETFIAEFNAPSCPQLCNLPPGNCPVYGMTEDCLFLTVMSPSDPPTAGNGFPNGYPVFFWMHGGAFTQGFGNSALYNGSTFALNDVVTVVINYRLGALGFLASDEMTGNYGFLDQRLAMAWTKNNIAGFGGNPNAITIGGQSSGAMSVSCHVASPGSRGLFNSIIMESNPFGLPYHTRESASKNAKTIFSYLGCDYEDMVCMRSKSIDEILLAQKNAIKLNPNTLFINFLPFAPLVEPDGEIPEQPLYAFQRGKQAALMPSALQGTVWDEGQLFVYELFPSPLSRAAYNLVLDTVFGRIAKTIEQYYPFDLIPGNTDGRNIFNVLATDLLFLCPLRNVTRGYQAALGPAAPDTYIYRFKHILSFDCWGANYTYCVGIVCHGSDLPFVFNVFTDGDTNVYTPTSDEVVLTTNIVNIWSNFLRNGDPNKGISIPFNLPKYYGSSDVITILDQPGSEDQSGVRDSYCDLWDTLGFFW